MSENKNAISFTDSDGDRVAFEPAFHGAQVSAFSRNGESVPIRVILDFQQLFALKSWVNDAVAPRTSAQNPEYIRRYEA